MKKVIQKKERELKSKKQKFLSRYATEDLTKMYFNIIDRKEEILEELIKRYYKLKNNINSINQ
jgi:hypothetical protein